MTMRPNRLRFDLAHADAVLRITIPTDRVAYAEEGETLRAGFRVTVTVLLDGASLEKFSEDREFRLTEEELLERDTLVITLPYALGRSGVYVFDVMVEDSLAVPPVPYRRSLRIVR